MEELETFLIIGLGNPGNAYRDTRHNVGFAVAELFAQKHRAKFKHSSELKGDLAKTQVAGKKVLLLLPTTFMNESGDSVRCCVEAHRTPLDCLMVVSDDVALPLGAMRIRTKGSSGGHNGLKSVEKSLNTSTTPALK